MDGPALMTPSLGIHCLVKHWQGNEGSETLLLHLDVVKYPRVLVRVSVGVTVMVFVRVFVRVFVAW